MVNKNFMILGIASIFVLAVIAAPQVFAGSDNSPSPSVANLSDVIGDSSISGFAPAAIDIDTNLGGFEPHVSYNPTNPANVVVTQGGSLIISLDSGATFPIGPVGATVPVGLVNYFICGDDVTTWDSQGRLFWTYLTCSFDVLGNLVDLSVTVVQVNPANGVFVNPPVDVTPGVFVDDKPWIAADANVGGGANTDNLYLIWSRLGTVGDTFFSRSTDQGVTWSPIANISSFAVDGFAWPPHITVAPNGDVYANYPTTTCGQTGTIQVLRDTNGGLQLAAGIGGGFTKNPAFTANQAQVTCNAQAAPTFGVFAPIPNTNFWLQGTAAGYTLADPNVAGKIYVVSNDDPDDNFGVGDDGDVVMATSLDFGVSFAVQTVAAGPANSLQVMPTAAIDPQGNIAISWYDTQNGGFNGAGNFLLDLYATTSTDGGATFVPPFQVNDNPFDPDLNAPPRFAGPPQTLRIGEYNGIAVTNCLVYNDWTGNNVAAPNNQEIFFDTFNIANCGLGDIHGFKYEDVDANGVFDAGTDVPLEDWEICLFTPGDEPNPANAIDCELTDDEGMVWFEDVELGDYVACETVQDGWTNTTDVCVNVSIDDDNREGNVEYGNLLAIEAEKTWTHTDYNWLVCDTPDATEQKGDCVLPDGTVLAEIPREGDITDPADDVLAMPLPQDGDLKYLVNAIVKSQNGKFQNTSPGAFYALTTINVLAEVDGLRVWEDYSECVNDDPLMDDEVDIELLAPKQKPERAVKVAIADKDGIATEISKDLYDAGAITFIGDVAHVDIDREIPAGSTVFVLVKFQHDMKNLATGNGVFDGMCDNTEKVDAFLLGQDASVTAEASLRITTES